MPHKEKIKRHFKRQFWLKYHMAFLLIGTGLAGVLANKFLLTLGISHIVIRYPLAIILSYLGFLSLMRLWLSYISRSYKMPLLLNEEKQQEQKAGTKSKDETFFDWSSAPDGFVPDDLCGLILLLFIISLLCIFGFAAVLIYEAPIILAEAAFQFMLAAGMIRIAQKIDRPDWIGSILKATWKPFLTVFTCAVLLGSCAEVNCENPTSLKAVIESCKD